MFLIKFNFKCCASMLLAEFLVDNKKSKGLDSLRRSPERKRILRCILTNFKIFPSKSVFLKTVFSPIFIEILQISWEFLQISNIKNSRVFPPNRETPLIWLAH